MRPPLPVGGEGPGVRGCKIRWRQSLDPLTRPAPAGESAGRGPPSPPKGRGARFARLLAGRNSYLSAYGALPSAAVWCPCRARRTGLNIGLGGTDLHNALSHAGRLPCPAEYTDRGQLDKHGGML